MARYPSASRYQSRGPSASDVIGDAGPGQDRLPSGPAAVAFRGGFSSGSAELGSPNGLLSQVAIHPFRVDTGAEIACIMGSSNWPVPIVWGPAMASPHYEIRVSGVFPPEALLDFECLTASVQPVETMLCGELTDLAALQRLLARLETFGARVVGVRRAHQHPGPGDGQRSA